MNVYVISAELHRFRHMMSHCLTLYSAPLCVGASGGSYHCHPDLAYGEESDKVSYAPFNMLMFIPT